MANNLLHGKRGIIFGALDENSIAWKTALQVYAEGGRFVLTNAPIAMRMGKINELAAATESIVVPADATSLDELTVLTQKAVTHLGGKLDFVLHSIGMSTNIRKDRPYGDLNYDWFAKTLDVSALSFHKIMHVLEKEDAMAEWGSIVALSYVAAQRVFPDYTDMAQAKAILESIARSYGYRFGKLKKVRVNTISQSPTMTTAGQGIEGFDVMYTYAEKMSALGNATAEDCANYVALLFSDYSRFVTMQNLMHDGGFSMVGISEEVIEALKAGQ